MKAGKTMITAKLDSVSILMGRVTPLRIEVVKDKDKKGELPLYKALSEGRIVGLLTDTIEISSASVPDTIEIGNSRIQINYQMIVQSFDSGDYKIPGIHYIEGQDTTISDDLFLKVVPVGVNANDVISPMTGVQPPQGGSIFDFLPDWFIKWWWLIILAIIIIIGVLWGVRRYNTVGYVLPKKPEDPPHVVALRSLNKLKRRHLWEDGNEKEYYTVLTEILRTYLEKRFEIKALEMTSAQIISTLESNPELKSCRSMMRQILDMADYVKFAKVRPLPDDNVKSFENAKKFIEETIPRSEESSVDEDGKEVRDDV